MMGHRQVEQAALFYEFSLERHIPADHLLRSIDRFVELGGCARKSRCCSRTSNASSSSTASDYEDRTVHATSSS